MLLAYKQSIYVISAIINRTLFSFCEKIENFHRKLKKKTVILHDALNSTKTIQIPANLRMRVCNQVLVHCTQFSKKNSNIKYSHVSSY